MKIFLIFVFMLMLLGCAAYYPEGIKMADVDLISTIITDDGQKYIYEDKK